VVQKIYVVTYCRVPAWNIVVTSARVDDVVTTTSGPMLVVALSVVVQLGIIVEKTTPGAPG